MAWEATRLRPLVLLVLLASGSWEQQLLQKWEGEELFITCQYPSQRSSRTKTWCKIGPVRTCFLLVTHPRPPDQPGNPRYVIRDYPRMGYFTVTMTALREKDSGLYLCGTLESSEIFYLRDIRLLVSPVPASLIDPVQKLAQSSTLPPVTTTTRGRTRGSPRRVTQLMSTASLSSPGLGVNPTHGTDGLSTVPRISITSIITIVVCGILSKSLVFMVLLIATQRSFGR